MRPTSSYIDLSNAEWKVLRDCADRFDTARSRGPVADWEPFLPLAGDRLRPRVLVELIKTDLEYGWRNGRGERLEHYAARFPELGSFATLAFDLIGEEYRLRHRFGDRPSPAEYRARFPGRDAEMAQLKATEAGGIRAKVRGPQSHLETASPVSQTQDDPRSPDRAPAAPPGPASQSEGGRYEMLTRLGSGQFGEVWKARAPGGVEVAVKILHHPTEHSEASKREQKSLEMIKNIRHPCLLPTYAIWTERDRLCIAMELADGTLRDKLNEYREQGLPGIPVKELFRYFKDAAEGIDYLHSQSVLHRDIKPDNLLLQKGHAKVADFGLARLQTQRMATVSFAGTPVYMAPEMWQNKAGPPSDLYSLAFAYAELRCGKRPISADDFVAIIAGQKERTLDLAGLEAPEQAVLLRALSKSPEDRPRSCLEFMAELRRALTGHAAATPAMGVPVAKVAPPVTVPVATPRMGGLLETVTESLMPTDERLGARQSATVPVVRPTRPKSRRLLLTIIGLLALANLIVLGTFFAWPLLKGTFGGSGEVAVTTSSSQSSSSQHGNGTQKDQQQEPDRQRQAEQQRRAAEEAAAKRRLAFPPPGFVPQPGTEMVDWKGRSFPRRLGYETKDGLTAWFVLVPAGRPGDEPPFYIMQNKVWAGLYQELLGTASSASADRLAPMTRVKVDDAQRCAVKLGGNLPTPQQWDRAAGLTSDVNASSPPIGPVLGHLGGPLHPTEPSDDVSSLGVRDLAGAGREWTRPAPVANSSPTAAVIVRGRCVLREPLTIQQLRAEAKNPQTQPASQVADDLGFRVVIELPE